MRNISQAKAELSRLIEMVERGQEVIIGRAGKPVAKIIPYTGIGKPRIPGRLKGKLKVSPDFDTLGEELEKAFGLK